MSATVETIGPSECDYTSPQAWYDAHKGDITADPNAPYIGEIEAGVYGAVVMDASTTDSGHYFHLRAKTGDKFAGQLDDPAGSEVSDTYPKLIRIECPDDYARFEHIGADGPLGAGDGNALWSLTGDHCLADSCVAQDASGQYVGYGFYAAGGSVVRNCVVARLAWASPYAGPLVGIHLDGGAKAYACAVHDLDGHTALDPGTVGVRVQSASSVARRIAVGTLTGLNAVSFDDNSGGSADIDYNAVTEGSVGDAGANSQTSLVPATEWVGAGATGTDFHLAGTSVKCLGNGGSLAGHGDAPSEDVDDEPLGFDIGVDAAGSVGDATQLGPWYRELAKPVPGRAPAPIVHPPLIIDPSLYVVPDLVAWYPPLSEPVLPGPPVPTGEQYFGPDPSLWPAVETITLDKWAQPLSEPVLPGPPVPTGEQFFQAEPSLWPAPEIITLDKWYRELAVAEFPPSPVPAGFAALPLEDIVTPDPFLPEWYQPLAEPAWPRDVRVQPALEVGEFLPSLFITRYYLDARGLYRVFNAAEYRFYRSSTGPPADDDEVWATSSTLPATPADTFADGSWWISVSWFNGVLDSGFLPLGDRGETFLRLDLAGGTVAGSPPAGPGDWRLEQQGGGVVRVLAWLYDPSTAALDQWAIGYTVDGGDPPEDAPDVTVAASVGPFQILEVDLPAQSHGATLKVRLQTRRNDGTAGSPVWVYSEGSGVETATIDAVGPTAILHLNRHPGQLPE